MKFKLILAFEKESSTTTRITPQDAAKLLSLCDAEFLRNTMKELEIELMPFGEKRQKEIYSILGSKKSD